MKWIYELDIWWREDGETFTVPPCSSKGHRCMCSCSSLAKFSGVLGESWLWCARGYRWPHSSLECLWRCTDDFACDPFYSLWSLEYGCLKKGLKSNTYTYYYVFMFDLVRQFFGISKLHFCRWSVGPCASNAIFNAWKASADEHYNCQCSYQCQDLDSLWWFRTLRIWICCFIFDGQKCYGNSDEG